jgi:hypothetical protein
MYKKRVYKKAEEGWFCLSRAGRTSLLYATIPSNKEYSMPQVKMLLNEIEHEIGRKITLEEWDSL